MGTQTNCYNELRGLTATVVNESKNSLHNKGQTGIIVDTSVCCARLACIEKRAAFNRETNQYYTIEEYSSAWITWDDIEIKLPIIEDYRIIITNGQTKSLRMVEGEVYSFTYKDKNVKLGINRSVGAKGYNITDLLTGLYLETDEDIVKLRCMLPKVAKEEAEYYINHPMRIKDLTSEISDLPTNYTKPVALFPDEITSGKK